MSSRTIGKRRWVVCALVVTALALSASAMAVGGMKNTSVPSGPVGCKYMSRGTVLIGEPS